MESCLLCLQLNKEPINSIKVSSTSWQELNITQVLWKHFWKLNTIQPESWICLTCWQVVDSFHQLYLSVEEAHANFGKIKVEKVTELLEFKEEISSPETESFGCVEPEILIEQNILQDFKNEEQSSQQEKEHKTGLEVNLLSEDPLEKIKINKTRKRRNSLRYYQENLKINSEPEDSIDNKETDTENDNDEDSDGNFEPTESNKEAVKSKQRRNHKEHDKFIAKNFKAMYCDICNCSLESFSFTAKHFLNEHNQKGYLVCCSRKFYNRNRLVDHLQCHLNPNHFKCSECGKVLSDSKNFKSHMLRVHRPNDVSLKHSCEICGKSFTQGHVLRSHKLTHLPKEEKKFPCTECGKFYASSDLLKTHTEVVHLKKHAKICYICGKTLGTSTEYRAHMNKHEGVQAPIINCDVCGLRLSSERGLKLHKESQHPVGGKQEHACPVCPKISPTLRALRKHIQTMHEKGNEHKCTICDKSFKRAEALREHLASHTGTPLYTCTWCPETFNSNSNMYAHRKKVHPKEWMEAKLQKYSSIT